MEPLTIVARILTACRGFSTAIQKNGPVVIKICAAIKMPKTASDKREISTLRIVMANLKSEVVGKIFK